MGPIALTKETLNSLFAVLQGGKAQSTPAEFHKILRFLFLEQYFLDQEFLAMNPIAIRYYKQFINLYKLRYARGGL